MNRAQKKVATKQPLKSSQKQQKATPKKSTTTRTQKRKMTTKKQKSKTTLVSSSAIVPLTTAQAFRKTRPVRGLWDTPQDEPGSKPEPYVDFFKDTPVNSLAGQLVRDMRDFFLVQTGNPQFFDRDYEQQKLLGLEQFNAHKKQLKENNYAGFRGHHEVDFNTYYYTRVDQVPQLNNGQEPVLRMNPKHSEFRSTISHHTQYHNAVDPIYLDHRHHVAENVGYISAGPYFVPRTKFQFPIMSVENDYLFFHD